MHSINCFSALKLNICKSSLQILQVILKQMGDFILRRCELSDIIPVIEINLRTLPEHYSDYFYESLLEELPEAFIVAEISGKIVGYIMCKIEHGFSNFKKLGFVKKGHIVSIAVIDEHRRKGFGSVLVDEAVKGVKTIQGSELYLEVRCSNNDAVKLYEKLGFSIIQRLKAYYRDGEDAYVMAIDFTS